MANDRRASSRTQAWLEDNPVELMKAITELQDGILHDGGGRNLQCPLCQWLKDRLKIDIPTNRLKIDIGDLPNTPVVRCTRVRHNQNSLVRAVTKATGISLMPRPSPSEIMARMFYRVEQMRLTPKYDGLPPRAQAVVEHLVKAVIVNKEPNGEVLRSKKDWMLALDTRSSRATNKAIDAALASGLVGRRRTASPTLIGGRPSYLYGLKCLPTETDRKWPRTSSTDDTRPGPKPGPRPSKVGLNPKKPIDIVESDTESYAGVGDYPPKPVQADPKHRRAGRMNFSSQDEDPWPS
jgi:hypothetical protein